MCLLFTMDHMIGWLIWAWNESWLTNAPAFIMQHIDISINAERQLEWANYKESASESLSLRTISQCTKIPATDHFVIQIHREIETWMLAKTFCSLVWTMTFSVKSCFPISNTMGLSTTWPSGSSLEFSRILHSS